MQGYGARTPNNVEALAAKDSLTGQSVYVTSTNAKLDVNASATLSGQAIPASGLTTAVAVQIVDGSGNQITSFGGGTQYTDAGTPPAHPVGPTLEWNNAGTWATVGSASPLPVAISSGISNPLPVSGTVTANAGTNLNTSLLATSANLTAGSQKTQIVDGSGNVIGATSNALDINIKSGNPSTIAVTQSTAASLNATVVGTGTFAVQATVASPGTIFNGKTTVATAGSRVTLAASQTVRSIVIKALAANTGTIYVGNTSVAASNGLQLAAGDAVSFDLTNLNTVNLDSSVNGEGVTYMAVA